MSDGRSYRFVLSTALWSAPAMSLAALLTDWYSSARGGLIAAFIILLLIRTWVVVGELSSHGKNAYAFTSPWIRVRGDLDSIRWVLRLRRLGVISRGAPWRYQLLLGGPVNEDLFKSWARRGVRVIGMSEARLAEDDRIEEYFSQP